MKKLIAIIAAFIAVTFTACQEGKTDPGCHGPKYLTPPTAYETDKSYEDILTYVNYPYTVFYSPEGESIAFAYPLFHDYGEEEMEEMYSGEDGHLIGRHLMSFDGSLSTEFALYNNDLSNITWENSIFNDSRYFCASARLDFENEGFSEEDYLQSKVDAKIDEITDDETEDLETYGPFLLKVNDSIGEILCTELYCQSDNWATKYVFAVHYVGRWKDTPVYMKIDTTETAMGDYKTTIFYDDEIINAVVASLELSDAKG